MSTSDLDSPSSNPYAPPRPSKEGAAPPVWAPDGGPSARVYKPAETVGVLAQIALWGYVGLAALSGIVSVLGLLGRVNEAWVILAISGLEVYGLPVAATLFCVWFYRVYANLEPLGRKKTDFATWWAPASFFVPIVNTVYPYEIAKECWIHSLPPVPEPHGEGGDDNGSPCVSPDNRNSARLPIAWWVCCVAWFVVGLAHAFAQVKVVRFSPGYFGFSVTLDCLTILAAICGIQMIRGINRRQQSSFHALGRVEHSRGGP